MHDFLKITDGQGKDHYINRFHVREVFIAMGNVVIEWDNGDKKTIDTNDANKMLKRIVSSS